MSDLTRLNAAIELIARLPNTAEYFEARKVGEAFVTVLAAADMRSAKPAWQPNAALPDQRADDLDHNNSWQRLGDVGKRVVAGLRRAGQ